MAVTSVNTRSMCTWIVFFLLFANYTRRCRSHVHKNKTNFLFFPPLRPPLPSFFPSFSDLYFSYLYFNRVHGVRCADSGSTNDVTVFPVWENNTVRLCRVDLRPQFISATRIYFRHKSYLKDRRDNFVWTPIIIPNKLLTCIHFLRSRET